MARAAYTWWEDADEVLVVDLDQGRSVTTDAGGVVDDLGAAGVDFSGKRVLYRDTMGRWDELVVAGGRFVAFAPGSPRDQERCGRAAAARGF